MFSFSRFHLICLQIIANYIPTIDYDFILVSTVHSIRLTYVLHIPFNYYIHFFLLFKVNMYIYVYICIYKYLNIHIKLRGLPEKVWDIKTLECWNYFFIFFFFSIKKCRLSVKTFQIEKIKNLSILINFCYNKSTKQF